MSKKPSEYVKPDKCKFCGYKIDCAHTPFGKRRPVPGDISVCLKCGNVHFFDDTLSLRKASAEELAALPRDIHRQLVSVKIKIGMLNGRN